MPIARVQTAEGRVARFEVPEGTTPEQAVAMVEKEFPNLSPEKPTAEKLKDLGKEALRQVGLTARYGIEGVTGLANTVGDAFGLHSSEAVSGALDQIGLPRPQGAQERIVGDVTRAMAGQAGVKGVADIARPTGPVAMRIIDLLRAEPKSQIIAAGGAGAGSGAAREAGAGPVGQTAAALLGGFVAPVAADAAGEAMKAGARGVRAAVDPFTQAGREKVVGSALRRAATYPDEAAAKLANAQEIVPGSAPTTAQAARDEGLLITERGVASSSPQAGARLARRASEQNQARNILLNEMAGDEAGVEAGKAIRDASTRGLREGAFSNKQPVDMAAVTGKLDEVLASPAGKRQTVSDAMTWLKGRLSNITDPEELYAIRQDIGDVLSGKLQGEKANLKLASSQLLEVRKVLDEAIEAGAPGFRQYLSSYASQSKPINQMETLQDLRARVTNAGTDAATGESILSPAKFSNALRKPESRAALQKTLTSEQFTTLEQISADLDRAALSASSGKAAGSNTTQNLSTAYVLGSTLGGKAADNAIVRNLARPLSWLNKLNETEIQELLVDAMLNPGVARSLMTRATPTSVESLGFELLQRARAKGIGAATSAAQSRPAEESKRQERQAPGGI